MSLNSGERQVASTIDGIRADHVARYEFAASVIPRDLDNHVIDFACGCGYGSALLAKEEFQIIGFDVDAEAIAYANKYYSSEKCVFHDKNAMTPDEPMPLPFCDAATCFETIEHLSDPRPLLRALREVSPLLVASVPNEDVMPYEFEPGKTYAFHHRHYRPAEFNDLLTECGWRVTGWHGQVSNNDCDVTPGTDGKKFIIVTAERCDIPKPEELPQGKHIAIIGLGPSSSEYLELTKRAGGRSALFDEVWTINALGDLFACDLVFHMDDVRIQEIRVAAKPDSNIAMMLKWLRTSPVPVVTSRKHEDYPSLVEFPLEDVLNHLGHDYFNNTAAYAVAFAIHTGATVLSLFGLDYTYPNVHDAEKGRACVEFWLGQAHARGIKINLPKCTTLMDSMYPQTSRLYGYDTLDIVFNGQPDGMVKLSFTPRETLPTAEQIEALYDHSAPIAEQHLGTKE